MLEKWIKRYYIMHYALGTWLYNTVAGVQKFEYLYDLDQVWGLSRKFAEHKTMFEIWFKFTNKNNNNRNLKEEFPSFFIKFYHRTYCIHGTSNTNTFWRPYFLTCVLSVNCLSVISYNFDNVLLRCKKL